MLVQQQCSMSVATSNERLAIRKQIMLQHAKLLQMLTGLDTCVSSTRCATFLYVNALVFTTATHAANHHAS